jgi:hypothetical protein
MVILLTKTVTLGPYELRGTSRPRRRQKEEAPEGANSLILQFRTDGDELRDVIDCFALEVLGRVVLGLGLHVSDFTNDAVYEQSTLGAGQFYLNWTSPIKWPAPRWRRPWVVT